jgi:3,4-dihydroxy 2-butanone 4-phosphate synthase / GTP cyclohydrolase II
MKHLVTSRLPTVYGQFIIEAYDSGRPELPHLLLRNIDLKSAEVVNLRIHSECLTGDVFGSTRCDCGEQLSASLHYIEKHGGMLLYLRQEGRGIGLVNKLKAYNLQDEGLNTIDANLALGFHTDERSYADAVEILKKLGITRVNIITNNPEKLEAFENSGIEVVDRIIISIEPRPENKNYLLTKKNSMGHFLSFI